MERDAEKGIDQAKQETEVSDLERSLVNEFKNKIRKLNGASVNLWMCGMKLPGQPGFPAESTRKGYTELSKKNEDERKKLVREIATDPRMTSWAANDIRNILITSASFDLLSIFNKNLPLGKF